MVIAASPSASLNSLSEHHLRQLLAASQAFNSTLELEVLIPRILDLITETCEAEAGSIWVLNDGVLQCQYAVGPSAQDLMWVELPLGVGIVPVGVLASCRYHAVVGRVGLASIAAALHGAAFATSLYSSSSSRSFSSA